MKLLNLGCGNSYHTDWINIDFVSNSKDILQYDLKKGIPFDDNEVDVVYHSHLLEHFSKDDANKFIKECYRVLKPNGVIRVAVPDLEAIVTGYLDKLQKALQGDEAAKADYEWLMLEMYDQTVRNYSGGEMANYLFNEKICNEEFVYSRIGEEGKKIRKDFLESKNKEMHVNKNEKNQKNGNVFNKIFNRFKNILKSSLLREEIEFYNKHKEESRIGAFRLSGEIHQWMYDRFSLSELLKSWKFKNIEVKSAFESNIIDWNKFQLDVTEGILRKPDSLFMEATK